MNKILKFRLIVSAIILVAGILMSAQESNPKIIFILTVDQPPYDLGPQDDPNAITPRWIEWRLNGNLDGILDHERDESPCIAFDHVLKEIDSQKDYYKFTCFPK